MATFPFEVQVGLLIASLASLGFAFAFAWARTRR